MYTVSLDNDTSRTEGVKMEKKRKFRSYSIRRSAEREKEKKKKRKKFLVYRSLYSTPEIFTPPYCNPRIRRAPISNVQMYYKCIIRALTIPKTRITLSEMQFCSAPCYNTAKTRIHTLGFRLSSRRPTGKNGSWKWVQQDYFANPILFPLLYFSHFNPVLLYYFCAIYIACILHYLISHRLIYIAEE